MIMSTFMRSLIAASAFMATISAASAAPDYLIYLDRSVYETAVPAAVEPIEVREAADSEDW
jgi:hypothetical protein